MSISTSKVWLVTGAGRGMGVDIAKAALEAGHKVVATARDPKTVNRAIGDHPRLHAAKLDVNSVSDAESAVKAAVDKFGRLDVVVNNAGNFFAGYFEELAPNEVKEQVETLLFGPMNVTRAALPIMRKQRSGHIINISSIAGLTSSPSVSAYSAAKFGVEGWTAGLAEEIAPFGIHTTIVNPGFFRTELITPQSMKFGSIQIEDYAERRREQEKFWTTTSGKQTGDPAKLAKGLVQIAAMSPPPRRWIAGKDAIQGATQKVETLKAEIGAFHELSTSLDFDADHAGVASTRPARDRNEPHLQAKTQR